jgi:tryptophan synthase beta chain
MPAARRCPEVAVAGLWIKICGMTTRDAIETAAEAGANAVGFVFYEASPRNLSIDEARALQAVVPGGVERVAVFLHPSQALVDAVVSAIRPEWVQTDLEDLGRLRLTEAQRVLPVLRGDASLPSPAPRRCLLESARSGMGERGDWSAAARMAPLTELVLAGGLDEHNVGEAVRAVRPFGVDVSSGRNQPRRAGRRADTDSSAARAAAAPGSLRVVDENHGPEDRREARSRRPCAARFRTSVVARPFGGRYVPETLVPALDLLEEGVRSFLRDPAFRAELETELRTWVGRPTPLTFARELSRRWGAEVWLKREDLAHTGAHKINNAIGQALLAKRLGAKRIVAETGAGQHGVASAAACARLGMPCVVYMGAVDMERQAPNVGRMKLLGAEVVPVTGGDKTLRAAIDEALRDWVADPNGTYYLLGSAVGPHPYPYLVREFQSVIGVEARVQMLEQAGALPDVAVACVGGGSNAIGLFHPFVQDLGVKLLGLEAGGTGTGLGQNAASLAYGTPGVLQGCYSLLLQDEHGQIQETHSVSAGLDYPGVGPEHALLASIGRVSYEAAADDESLEALAECCQSEGILPAIESAHAFAGAKRYARDNPGSRILIGLSGRGDKDMPTLQQTLLRGKP